MSGVDAKAQPSDAPASVLALECRELSVGRAGACVLADLDLTVAPGRLLALLGPSGSGKTTLLDTVAGFVPPLGGRVLLSGRLASTARRCSPPERRSVGVVFQHYALWPHLSVLETVAYPARRRGLDRASARAEANRLLDRLHISALSERRPAELSGGEQQRVALARALARRPDLFLFDEPTAHLDAHLRGVVLEEIARHRADDGAGAVYATHDAAEALAVADAVAVLDAGRLAQLGPPDAVYQRPVNLRTARLTGPASVLTAPARPGAGPSLWVTVGPAAAPAACAEPRACDTLLVRPDWVEIGEGPFSGVVTAVRYRGPHTEYTLASPAGSVRSRRPGAALYHVGDRVSWSLTRVWPLPDHDGDGTRVL